MSSERQECVPGYWDDQAVYRILNSPKYAGCAVFNGHSKKLGSLLIPRACSYSTSCGAQQRCRRGIPPEIACPRKRSCRVMQ